VSILELRQYTLRPGQRDVLIELFERELIEPQESAGAVVVGQFCDLERPDRFVWLRAFSSMAARKAALQAFYGGPVWEAYRHDANATMIDSDNVLLLRTVGTESLLQLAPRAPRGSTALPRSIVVASIYTRAAAIDDRFLRLFETVKASTRPIATFCTEYAENDFPALPVRTGEHVVVTLCRFEDRQDYRAQAARLVAPESLIAQLGLQAIPEHLVLSPTARSALR
jgi:hypothetical protein